MNTNNKVKLIGTIVGIVLFILLMTGISYAWFTWRSSNISIAGTTECFDIHYTNGRTITNDNIILFDESKIISDDKITIKNGMAITDVTAYMDSNCNIPAYLEVTANITNLNSAFISGNSVGAFKYAVATYDPASYSDITTESLEGLSFDIIEKGSITSLGETNLMNEAITKVEKGYLIAFYVDGDLAMNDAGNTTFEASITGVASQVSSYEATPIEDFIYYLGSEHSSVDQITYQEGDGSGSPMPADISIEENEVLLVRYTGKSTFVSIPDTYTINGVEYNVTVLSYAEYNDSWMSWYQYSGVFYLNEYIETVYIGDNVKYISNIYYVDSWNDDWTEPIGSATRTDNSAQSLFYSCKNLSEVNINLNSVTNMDSTFSYCENMTKVPEIPNSVTSLSYTFSSCTGLTEIPTIPNSVTNMNGTFSGCTNLTSAPEIPNSVTNMSYTFYNCTNLTEAPQIPNSVTNMNGTFSGCERLTSAPEIPDSVTNMSYTFAFCTNLTSAPEIPNSVTNMSSTFSGCTRLTSPPEIPDSVTNMSYTFSSCTNLTSAPEIPTSVTNMNSTFANCPNLTGVVRINAAGVTSISSIFNRTSKSITVEVPAGSTTYTKISALSTSNGMPSNVTLSTFTAS